MMQPGQYDDTQLGFVRRGVRNTCKQQYFDINRGQCLGSV